jgi:hypothetical protein
MNRRESRLHDHRSRHYEDAVQNILLIVGILSISGLLSLLATLYFGSTIPGQDTDPGVGHYIPWWHIGIASGVYVVFGLPAWLYFRRKKGR